MKLLKIVLCLLGLILAGLFLPWLAYTWLDFLLTPFLDFTFTDPPDFLFAGLILLTLFGLAVRHLRRPYSAGWLRFASATAFVVAVVAPLVPLAVLHLLFSRAEQLIGHRPRFLVDDPKFIGPNDPAYQGLKSAFTYASAFAGWGLYTWVALLLHLRQSVPVKRLYWLVGVFLLAWAAFVADKRYVWWLD